jgi:hypothetical protein
VAATDGFWAKFRHWRRRRPFWGSLLLLLAGLEMFYTANQDIGNLQIHMGQQGFLSYVLPTMLILCGLLCAFTPAQRLFYGIVGVLTALYSFIGLNLGGFIIGMLLGIIGGALVIAWGPPKSRPGSPTEQPPTGEPTDHQEEGPVDVGDEIFGERDDIDETQPIQIAGHDDRPHDEQPVRPASFAAPASSRRAGPHGLSLQGLARLRLGRHRKAIALAMAPLMVTATIVVGSNLQASAADDCPDGVPSALISPSATGSPSAGGSSAAAAAKKAGAAAKKTTAAAKTTTPAAGKTTTPAAGKTTAAAKTTSATPTATATKGAIEGFIDGLGNLLGVNGEESSSPSESPSTPETATSAPTTEPTADPTKTTEPTAEPTKTTEPTAEPSKTTGATTTATTKADPSASTGDIPCLGARILGKVASPDDIPPVAVKPGRMEVDSLVMTNLSYDGVVDMPMVGGGTFKALKFSMDSAVNKPFKLTIDEPNGTQTKITSAELTTTGQVRFYTPEFKGKIAGLIPVVFTPDSPPPFIPPIIPIPFTDVEIKLAFVRSNKLTGDPLRVANP